MPNCSSRRSREFRSPWIFPSLFDTLGQGWFCRVGQVGKLIKRRVFLNNHIPIAFFSRRRLKCNYPSEWMTGWWWERTGRYRDELKPSGITYLCRKRPTKILCTLYRPNMLYTRRKAGLSVSLSLPDGVAIASRLYTNKSPLVYSCESSSSI